MGRGDASCYFQMKHSKVKQSDLDRLVPAVLFQESEPDTPERRIKTKRHFEECPECLEDDLSFEGVLDGKRIYVCYCCGYERQEDVQ